MKVLKVVLVNHTKNVAEGAEERFYRTNLDEVAKDDIFACWAHGKLAFGKVRKVYAKYEYLKSENAGVELDEVPFALDRIDFKSYNIAKAVAAKAKRLTSALKERVEEFKEKKTIKDILTGSKGAIREDVDAILADMEALKSNPESALED